MSEDVTQFTPWWRFTPDYWDLPFYAEAGLCCDAMTDKDDALAAREQLWAIREGLAEFPERS